MTMLTQLNKFIYNYISEAAEATENQDEAKKEKIEIFTTNEFFFRFVNPIAEEAKVIATKQRENTFLIYGYLKDVKNFFSKLKVDDTYMEKPSEFTIFSPQFTYGDEIHNLKRDEEYPTYSDLGTAPTTHEIDNMVRNTVSGKWFSMIEDKNARRIKGIKPSDITKYFKNFFPKADKKFNEETPIYVEFQVNCDRRANQVYDEMSEYAKNPDEMNDAHNADPDDFDYTVLNIKNENDESTVKDALKDVKKTFKDFKPETEVKK